MFSTKRQAAADSPSCGAETVSSNGSFQPIMMMRKTRSVDFGRIRARSSLQKQSDAGTVASNFSRRAARDCIMPPPPSPGFFHHCYKEGIPLPAVSFPEYRFEYPEQEDPWAEPDCLSGEAAWGTDQVAVVSETSTTTTTMRIPVGTWTVGKLSVLILLFVTFTDFALSESLRPRLGLGSAAISTVTETLSPILPFTGGVDLRREDYWTKKGTWFETLQSVAVQVMDAFDTDDESADDVVGKIPRGGGNLPGKLAAQRSTKKRKTNHVSAISAQQLFVDAKAIEDLTLEDVAETFRYALESSKASFNEGRFINSQQPRVKKVLTAMQEAVGKSRGKDAKDSLVTSNDNGEIDALKFSAAMRIFAEWRVLRQVPEGYKGYAVGMSLGHKDVVQNLAKIEQTVHSWLDHQRDVLSLQAQWEKEAPGESCPADRSQAELRSPTLRELLQHEVEMEVHPILPRLKDKTSAMGLLWVRRQLQYQTETFFKILDVPTLYPSSKDAVLAAYREVYDKYHGWTVQKIFSYSFQAAPEAVEIFKFMNPHRMEEVLMEAQRVKSSRSTKPIPVNATLAPESDIEPEENDHPVIGFFKHVGGEWDKVVGVVFGGDAPSIDLSARGGSGTGGRRGLNGKELDDFISQKMVDDAHQHIAEYLEIANPLLENLAGLFDTYNMDDPTKV